MSRLRRRSKLFLAVATFALLVFVLSACAIFKPESLQVSQPGGIGSVRVHFALCTGGENSPECHPNGESGQSEYMLGIAVPAGSTAPATVTAQPVGGGRPIDYTRNDEVAKVMAEGVAQGPEEEFPPAGTEVAGYLSSLFDDEAGASGEWTVDLDFGLPPAGDGGSSAPVFKATVASGWRQIDAGHPADRPISCFELEPGPEPDSSAWCEVNEGREIGTSDLKIPAPAPASAYIGGTATISFLLDFASTASALPSFNLTAASTLPGATPVPSSSTFAPGTPDATTHRLVDPRAVAVTVPKTAQPGLYDVTLTATTAQGAAVSQVAKLQVTKPKLKLGKVKLNKARGTAILFVTVPTAGTLTASGKGLAKAKRKAGKAKTLKVTLRAKGKAKTLLKETGKAKVGVKVTFKPLSGASVTKTRRITLKQN